MLLLTTRVIPSVALGLAAGRASAQLVLDPFAYPSGAALDGQINPANGLPWSAMSASGSDDNIQVGGSSLSYAGLSGSSGGSVAYGGSGKTERLSLGAGFPVTSGTIYYSMLLSVTSLGGLGSSNAFMAGLNPADGPSGVQPTTIGARLYIRQGSTSTAQNPTFNLGVSKNSSTNSDIAFDTTEFALNTPVLVVGSYQIVGSGPGTDDLARLYINPQGSNFGVASAPTISTAQSPILTAPAVGTDLTAGGAPTLAGFMLRQGSSAVPNVQVDELRIDPTWAQVTPPVGVSWNVNADGDWPTGANWTGDVAPNDPGAFVTLGTVNTAARTITLTSPVNLRTLDFASGNSYIVSGSQPLNFSASAAINALQPAGNHSISAPVSLAGDLEANISLGATVTISGDLSANGNSLSKTGAGTLVLKNARVNRLSIAGGSVSILSNGTASGASQVNSLAIAPQARLDLKNNALIVGGSSTGTWNGSTYTGVTGLVSSGRDGGAWDGGGIVTTSATPGNNLTTLAVAKAGDVRGISDTATTTFDGQVVHGSDTLVMYTYGGDADLDGRINIDDYGRIDTNIGLSGSVFGWYNGDFNYDGKINIDDYGIIDANIGIQGPPFPTSPQPLAGLADMGVTAAPEPASLGLLAMAAGSLVMRRRRARP